MSAPRSSRRGAVATYVLVGLVALLDRRRRHAELHGPAKPLEVAAGTGVTTHGEWIYIKRGHDSIRAYVAYPERKTKAPAVIVIHEIFGLTDWEPTVADRLAKEGFVAILPGPALVQARHHAGRSRLRPQADRRSSSPSGSPTTSTRSTPT